MSIEKVTAQLIHKTIHKVGWIELPAEGTSMFPLIKEGDRCRFIGCDPHALKRADIALFSTEAGNLVAHRFYDKQIINGETVFLFKGDTNLGCDEPIRDIQIIGKLAMIGRKSVGRPVAYLWGRLIMAFPFLSALLQRYLRKKTRFQSGVSS